MLAWLTHVCATLCITYHSCYYLAKHLLIQNNNTTTTMLRPLVQNYPGKLVPEETFTHSHLSGSSTILYQLPPSTVIHSILPIHFTCLTAFLHNLSPWSTSGPDPSTTYSIRFFTQSSFSFHNICPYHCSMFCCSTEIMSSLSKLFTWNYLLP